MNYFLIFSFPTWIIKTYLTFSGDVFLFCYLHSSLDVKHRIILFIGHSDSLCILCHTVSNYKLALAIGTCYWPVEVGFSKSWLSVHLAFAQRPCEITDLPPATRELWFICGTLEWDEIVSTLHGVLWCGSFFQQGLLSIDLWTGLTTQILVL